MPQTPDIASVAGLMGEPTRAAILMMLMDGTAHTATELALEGGVAPSTASSHLARLEAGGLVTIVKQGRHRYFRIATPEVAAAVEGLSVISPRVTRPRAGPADESLRRARVCYDHLAGEAGVRLFESLRERDIISGGEDGLILTRYGREWCELIGIDLAALRHGRRLLLRCCLDWSERRMHLAGALGAAICECLFASGCARREPDSRAITFSARGEQFLHSLRLAR